MITIQVPLYLILYQNFCRWPLFWIEVQRILLLLIWHHSNQGKQFWDVWNPHRFCPLSTRSSSSALNLMCKGGRNMFCESTNGLNFTLCYPGVNLSVPNHFLTFWGIFFLPLPSHRHGNLVNPLWNPIKRPITLRSPQIRQQWFSYFMAWRMWHIVS